jgi:site-specific DNA recombinase
MVDIMPLRLPDFPLPVALVSQMCELAAREGVPTLAYARISDDREGKGVGEAIQLADQIPLFERYGLRLAGVYLDNDISAYGGKPRPDYEALLADLRSGVGRVITAWHPDRVYRELIDLVPLIDLVNDCKASIYTARAGEIDLTTPTGRLAARIVGAVATYEIEHGKERMKAARSAALLAGKYTGGRRVYGYEPDGITIREAEAGRLRDAARRVLAGESPYSLAKEFGWTSTQLRRTLVRPRYAGLIVHQRTEIESCWPGILSVVEWRGLVALFADPSRFSGGPRGQRVWLGTGLYRCGRCDDDTRMKVGSRTTYRCKKYDHLGRAVEPVDRFVSMTMVRILQRPGTQLRLQESATVDVAGLETEAASIREQLDELARERGRREIDGREYKLMADPMKADLDRIKAALAASAARSPLSGIADAADVAAAWKAAPLSRKRAVIEFLATVTIFPARPGVQPGGGYFDADSVVIEPKD